MRDWFELRVWQQRHEGLIREAETQRLAKALRAGRIRRPRPFPIPFTNRNSRPAPLPKT